MFVRHYLRAGKVIGRGPFIRMYIQIAKFGPIFGQVLQQNLSSNWIAQNTVGPKRHLSGLLPI